MKKTGLLLKIFLIFSLTMCFTACTVVEECNCGKQYIPDLKSLFFTVDVKDWWWNGNLGRYEFQFNAPDITNNIYENGLVHAGIFIWESGSGGNYEVLKSLPYVQSYYDARYDITYTETISYDISPGSILFCIQLSDLYSGDEFLQTYEFKVSLLY